MLFPSPELYNELLRLLARSPTLRRDWIAATETSTQLNEALPNAPTLAPIMPDTNQPDSARPLQDLYLYRRGDGFDLSLSREGDASACVATGPANRWFFRTPEELITKLADIVSPAGRFDVLNKAFKQVSGFSFNALESEVIHLRAQNATLSVDSDWKAKKIRALEDATVDRLQENAKLRETNAALQRIISDAQGRINGLTGDVERLGKALNPAQEVRHEWKDEARRLSEAVDQLKSELREAKELVDRHEKTHRAFAEELDRRTEIICRQSEELRQAKGHYDNRFRLHEAALRENAKLSKECRLLSDKLAGYRPPTVPSREDFEEVVQGFGSDGIPRAGFKVGDVWVRNGDIRTIIRVEPAEPGQREGLFTYLHQSPANPRGYTFSINFSNAVTYLGENATLIRRKTVKKTSKPLLDFSAACQRWASDPSVMAVVNEASGGPAVNLHPAEGDDNHSGGVNAKPSPLLHVQPAFPGEPACGFRVGDQWTSFTTGTIRTILEVSPTEIVYRLNSQTPPITWPRLRASDYGWLRIVGKGAVLFRPKPL